MLDSLRNIVGGFGESLVPLLIVLAVLLGGGWLLSVVLNWLFF